MNNEPNNYSFEDKKTNYHESKKILDQIVRSIYDLALSSFTPEQLNLLLEQDKRTSNLMINNSESGEYWLINIVQNPDYQSRNSIYCKLSRLSATSNGNRFYELMHININNIFPLLEQNSLIKDPETDNYSIINKIYDSPLEIMGALKPLMDFSDLAGICANKNVQVVDPTEALIAQNAHCNFAKKEFGYICDCPNKVHHKKIRNKLTGLFFKR